MESFGAPGIEVRGRLTPAGWPAHCRHAVPLLQAANSQPSPAKGGAGVPDATVVTVREGPPPSGTATRPVDPATNVSAPDELACCSTADCAAGVPRRLAVRPA